MVRLLQLKVVELLVTKFFMMQRWFFSFTNSPGEGLSEVRKKVMLEMQLINFKFYTLACLSLKEEVDVSLKVLEVRGVLSSECLSGLMEVGE